MTTLPTIELEREVSVLPHLIVADDTLWRTKDKRYLRVSGMETSHIQNCIAMIERSRMTWRLHYYDRLRLA